MLRGFEAFGSGKRGKEVVAKLKARMAHLIVGDPLDKNTDIGAINSKAQCDRIQDYLKVGQEEGAELFQTNCPIPEKGYFIRPSFFTKVAQSHRIVQEEILALYWRSRASEP